MPIDRKTLSSSVFIFNDFQLYHKIDESTFYRHESIIIRIHFYDDERDSPTRYRATHIVLCIVYMYARELPAHATA